MDSGWRSDVFSNLEIKVINLGVTINSIDKYREFFHPTYKRGIRKSEFIKVPDDMIESEFIKLKDTWEEIMESRLPPKFDSVIDEIILLSDKKTAAYMRLSYYYMADIVKPSFYVIDDDRLMFADSHSLKIDLIHDRIKLNRLNTYRFTQIGVIELVRFNHSTDLILQQTGNEILNLEGYTFRVSKDSYMETNLYSFVNRIAKFKNFSDMEIYQYIELIKDRLSFNLNFRIYLKSINYFMPGLNNNKYNNLFLLLDYIAAGLYCNAITFPVRIYSALFGFVSCINTHVLRVSNSPNLNLNDLNDAVFFYYNYDSDKVYTITPFNKSTVHNNSNFETYEGSDYIPVDTEFVDGTISGIDVTKKNIGPLPTSIKAYCLIFHNEPEHQINITRLTTMFNILFDSETYNRYMRLYRNKFYAELYKFKCLLIADTARPRIFLIGYETEYHEDSFLFFSHADSFNRLADLIYESSVPGVYQYIPDITLEIGNITSLPYFDFYDDDKMFECNEDGTISIVNFLYETPYSDPVMGEPDALYIIDNALTDINLDKIIRCCKKLNNKFKVMHINTIYRRAVEVYSYNQFIEEFNLHVGPDFIKLSGSDYTDFMSLLYTFRIFYSMGDFSISLQIVFVYGPLNSVQLSPDGVFSLSFHELSLLKDLDDYSLSCSLFFYYEPPHLFLYNRFADLNTFNIKGRVLSSQFNLNKQPSNQVTVKGFVSNNPLFNLNELGNILENGSISSQDLGSDNDMNDNSLQLEDEQSHESMSEEEEQSHESMSEEKDEQSHESMIEEEEENDSLPSLE